MGNKRVTVQVRGLAGTGKTTVIAVLMEALEGLGIKCSYSGEDSEVLRERICEAMVNEIPDVILDGTEVEIIEEVSKLTPEMNQEAMSVSAIIHERQNAMALEEFEKKQMAMMQEELSDEIARQIGDGSIATSGTFAKPVDPMNDISAHDFLEIAKELTKQEPAMDRMIGNMAIKNLKDILK